MKITDIEKRIIRCVCLEMTDKEIGDALGKSKRTVESHKERLRLKLDVKNSVGLALWGVKNGIFKP